MEVQPIVVPYDSGQRDVRMGAGPLQLLAEVVVPLFPRCEPLVIRAPAAFQSEIATAFRLNRIVAEEVRATIASRKVPLILSGNCNVAIGTTAGLDTSALGVVWLDAHGDFNTPETTTSGFLDGMGLATIAGLCWVNMAASVVGFRAVAGANILHIS